MERGPRDNIASGQLSLTSNFALPSAKSGEHSAWECWPLDRVQRAVPEEITPATQACLNLRLFSMLGYAESSEA